MIESIDCKQSIKSPHVCTYLFTTMDVFSNTAYFVANTLGFLCSLIYRILDLNFLLMSHIITIIGNVVQHFTDILRLLLTGLLTAIEEFAVFLIEIFHTLTFIKHGFEESLAKVGYSINAVTIFVSELINRCILAISSLISLLINSILTATNTVYSLFCLSIRSIVILLQMFPHAIVILCNTIKSLTIIAYQSMTGFFSSIVSFIAGFTLASFKFIEHKILLIPRDAIIGLAMVFLCYALYRAHRSGHIQCPARVLNAACALRRTLYCSLEFILTWFWLFRPQNPDQSGGEENLNDQNQNDSDVDDQNDESVDGIENVSALKMQLEQQKEKSLCLICQDAPKSIIFLPCRHMCLCEDCCNQLLNRRATCPLCRKAILNPIKVYT